jgi:hypothetical protein
LDDDADAHDAPPQRPGKSNGKSQGAASESEEDDLASLLDGGEEEETGVSGGGGGGGMSGGSASTGARRGVGVQEDEVAEDLQSGAGNAINDGREEI